MNSTHDLFPPVADFQPTGWRPARTERVTTFGKWKDFVHDNFPWLEHRNHSAGSFDAEVSAHRFGSGELSTIRANACEVIRTRHLAEVAEGGHIKLMWQIQGSVHFEQDSRRCVLEAGQATVCDTARPYRIGLADGAQFAVFMLPHQACPGWQQISERICGVRLPEGAAIRAALGSLMALTSMGQQSQGEDISTVIQAIQSMITSALHRCASAQGVSTSQNPKIAKAQRYILDHIANPALSANELASTLCMSRRSLYMLFKECDLTPARLIQSLRLEQSMKALADAAQQGRKITDVAFDNGFSDYATFSRLFKAEYGVTPSEFRIKARRATH